MNLVINGRLITRDTEGKGYYEHGAVAMASVFPVPLQYTTATLLIRL